MPSNPGVFVPVLYSSEGGTELPTTEGRRLRIAEGLDVRGLLAIRNETCVAGMAGEEEETFEELPTDVLSAELRIADAQGRLWQTTSSFSAELLVSRMVDLSYVNSSLSWDSRSKRKSEVKSPFDAVSALKDVIVSCDDRAYRHFTIDGKRVVAVKFEYTVLAFDVAWGTEVMDPHHVSLRVRLRDDCLQDRRTDEDLGGLCFSINWQELFRRNTHKRTSDGVWRSSSLPLPLIFQPLRERADPQEGVTLV
jgi:hypothetical protein